MNGLDFRLLLACCLALCAASQPAHARSGKSPATVVVQDAYVDLRSGPGRGFPATYSVERDSTIALLRQRTDWIKVRTDGGREGWVHRSQLERTLTPGGAPVQVAGPQPEARTEHHWEVGLGTGDFGVEGMPSTVFVDRKGQVRYVHRGYKPGDEARYADMIRSLVKE